MTTYHGQTQPKSSVAVVLDIPVDALAVLEIVVASMGGNTLI